MTDICANVPYVSKTTLVRSSKTSLLVESYMMPYVDLCCDRAATCLPVAADVNCYERGSCILSCHC